ncbi:MAG: spermidine/putrescine ABC transporter substrate-binding protein [Propionibacteriaceae bacterium]|nr:spermidine/putrescine ABC transporter substrate-binding protein [Propionibacteriaceae bacterium]
MTEPLRFLGPEPVARQVARSVSRRRLLAGIGVLGLGALTGCTASTQRMADSPAPDGMVENKLNLYSWGDYDDPELLDRFKDDHGLVLQVDSFGSNEEMIAKLAAARGTSGYDVVVPTGLMIPQMVEHNLLQPLDMDRIPNFSNIDPEFTGQYFDRDNTYSVCKAWGTTGFVYDTEVITRSMESWADFVDAAQNEADGRTALLEDPWEVCSIALGSQGVSLNTTDDAELEECRRIVVDELAPHIRAYLGNAATGMAQGTVSLLQAFNGDARQGMLEAGEGHTWRFVFPTPSANLWMDNWCLATGAPHPDAAHAFIDAMISPEAAIANVDYIGYPVGTRGLEEQAREAELEDLDLIFPDQEVLDRLEASEYNEGQQARVEIFGAAQARSGA